MKIFLILLLSVGLFCYSDDDDTCDPNPEKKCEKLDNSEKEYFCNDNGKWEECSVATIEIDKGGWLGK